MKKDITQCSDANALHWAEQRDTEDKEKIPKENKGQWQSKYFQHTLMANVQWL